MSYKSVMPVIALLLLVIGSPGVMANQSAKHHSEYTDRELMMFASSFQPKDIAAMPNMIVSNSTIDGTDRNNNGYRDDVEAIFFQLTFLIPDITKQDFDRLLLISRMFNDQGSGFTEKDIAATYQKLPRLIKREISLGMIYDIVLNTPMRRSAFAKQVKYQNTVNP